MDVEVSCTLGRLTGNANQIAMAFDLLVGVEGGILGVTRADVCGVQILFVSAEYGVDLPMVVGVGGSSSSCFNS